MLQYLGKPHFSRLDSMNLIVAAIAIGKQDWGLAAFAFVVGGFLSALVDAAWSRHQDKEKEKS